MISITACKTNKVHKTKSSDGGVYLVRHADRNEGIDSLNQLGQARAEELSSMLFKKNIKAIYCTKYNRTQETARPLANTLGIEPIIYKAMDYDALITLIQTQHKNETVLVVGHSNTIPGIINAFGYEPALADLEHHEYDKLFYLEYLNEIKLQTLQLGKSSSHH